MNNFNQAVTLWDGNPVKCRVVDICAMDQHQIEFYWARPYVGQQRQAVEVTADGKYYFYLDNADGSGIYKVTNGGHMRLGHRSLYPEPYTEIKAVPEDKIIYPSKELYEAVESDIRRLGLALYGQAHFDKMD